MIRLCRTSCSNRLRDPRKALRLAQADAEALIRDHGGEANREARQRERDGIALTVAADDGQAGRPRYGNRMLEYGGASDR